MAHDAEAARRGALWGSLQAGSQRCAGRGLLRSGDSSTGDVAGQVRARPGLRPTGGATSRHQAAALRCRAGQRKAKNDDDEPGKAPSWLWQRRIALLERASNAGMNGRRMWHRRRHDSLLFRLPCLAGACPGIGCGLPGCLPIPPVLIPAAPGYISSGS